MTVKRQQNINSSDEHWKNEYSKQRKDRMQDAIDDYLNDDRVSVRQTYEEMLSCINDVIEYHKNNLDRSQELKSLMIGHKNTNLDFPAWPGEVTNNLYDDRVFLTEN